MSCLAPPAKRVWRGIRARLGLRGATGLRRLRKEVRTCEYSDVHVMWEMLSEPHQRRPGRQTTTHHRRRQERVDAAGQEGRPCCCLEPAGVLLLRALMSSVWS